jgi:hypothetical protein
MNFQELLDRIEMLKAEKHDIKVHVGALANLFMSGALDSFFETKPTLKERFQFIAAIKKAANSEASLSNAKQPQLDINNLTSEFTRMRWLKRSNPLFSFRMYEYYKSAILSMKNYQAIDKGGLVYLKATEEGWNTWIFKSWNACTQSDVVNIIQNINNDHNQTVKIAVGFVCVLDKFVVKKNDEWGDILEVFFDDGQGSFSAVVWSDRKTKKSPPKLFETVKELVGKPCICIGKLTNKNRVGLNLWQLQELLS